MAVLAADALIQLTMAAPDEIESQSCVATDILYQGAVLGFNSTSGDVRPCVAGDVFAGFAMERIDNSTGAAGAKRIRIQTKGVLKGVAAITGASGKGDIGSLVYAVNDNPTTLTLTASTNTLVGTVVGYHVDLGFDVRFHSAHRVDIDTDTT